MGFFDDDPFDEIMKEFLGGTSSRRNSARNVLSGEREERIIDYVEEEDKVYFVFEILGYEKEDISVEVSGDRLKVRAIKKNAEGVQPYLVSKLDKGVYFEKTIPKGIKHKKFNWTFYNGILEVSFLRK